VSYPVLPTNGKTGLLLFGAAFQGDNDGQYLRAAGYTCTVVDIDAERIEQMRPLYPDDWTFVCADAYRFASDAIKRGARWDVVSVDPFTDQADLVFAAIETLFVPLSIMLTVVGVQSKNFALCRKRKYAIIERNSEWAWIAI
jgi:hypothetical protein